ncbi:hypothetical protein [Kitasatospora sp. NPDC056184]|uniref:hypothetical protein n=1 Tax=Kitasatospora sp. NPDC056184 TaxID=3345738 RepID=UPI0035DE059F
MVAHEHHSFPERAGAEWRGGPAVGVAVRPGACVPGRPRLLRVDLPQAFVRAMMLECAARPGAPPS